MTTQRSTTPLAITARARRGVRALLTHSLALSRHDEVLLISDEDHLKEIQLVTEVAAGLEIDVCTILVPISRQPIVKQPSLLPGIIRESIHHCQAMIVLIGYSAASTPFRMSLLRYFTDIRKSGRAASMPGVTLPELHYADADYEEIDRVAGQIAHLLLRTSLITVETFENGGRPHTLEIPVGRYFPTICGSTIEQGDWDNVPTGETFALPQRGRAEGSIAISGSVPGMVLERTAPAILKIKAGRINGISSADQEVQSHTNSLFFRDHATRMPKSRNASTLCEIGFGVNRAIRQLHGLPIFDEKMFGTIHVAFGRNDQLGGNIKGSSHHDLVTLRPRVFFDCLRTPIVDRGKFLPTDREVELDWSELKPRFEHLWMIQSTGLHCSYDPRSGGLVMEWMQCAGPPSATRVGNLETSILAATAYRSLTGPMRIGSLIETLRSQGLSQEVGEAAIEVLRSYKIARISRR
jgi:hypothetical protein